MEIQQTNESVLASNGSGGLDGMLLGNMAVAMNFTAETMDTSDGLQYGYRLKNDTYVGALGDILQYRSDVSFNIRFMKYYDTQDIEFLHPIYSDQLCVLSPKSLEIPQWLAIFLCFHPYVWVSFVTIGFVGGYCWYILRQWALRKVRRYRFRLLKGDNAPYSVLSIELWLVLLGASSTHLPRRMVERLLLAAFLIANVIISGTFQGTLTTAFSTKSYYKDINTLSALDKSGLPIGTSSRSLLDIFGNDALSPLYQSLKGKLRILDESARHRAAFRRDMCCIERHSDVHLIINTEFIGTNGLPMLHVIDECPRMYSLAYIVRKGWPFAPLFNAAIYRFIEAGLSKKWYADTEEALIMQKRIQQMMVQSEEPALRKLTMTDMQTSFYIMALGMLISLSASAGYRSVGKRDWCLMNKEKRNPSRINGLEGDNDNDGCGTQSGSVTTDGIYHRTDFSSDVADVLAISRYRIDPIKIRMCSSEERRLEALEELLNEETPYVAATC
uniref:Ionotropic glutamate receptor C-terminal domain-containing protein n=1 Tax=Anopheles farauti TaxID=69004 RepID=A0A182Q1E7_9DIPT